MARLQPSLAPPLGGLVVVAAMAAVGCIIPVAPQWDDAEVNYPPYIVSSSPTEGDLFTPGMTPQGRDINATLSDQNVNDHLFIRWLVDYPSGDMSPSHLIREVELPPSGTPIRSVVHIQPDCTVIDLGPGLHRWVMSVSDRSFLDALNGDEVDPTGPLDSMRPEANRIRVVWLLNCP
jgi:hypothetical protein